MRLSFPVHLFAAVAAASALLSAQTVSATPVDTLIRIGPATYDADRQQAVMLRQFVFDSLSGPRGDLATWNGSDWVPIQPPIVLAMKAAALLHDPLHDRLVAFDGNTSLQFVSGQHVTVGPTVPPVSGFTLPMQGRQLVHDLARDELVVFGGVQVLPPFSQLLFNNETYVLRQGTWVQMSPAIRPTARSGYAFAHDPLRSRSVLFGGNGNFTAFGDTWEWDGIGWTQISVIGPPPGSASGSYDPVLQRVVVRDRNGDTWSYGGAAWSQLGAGTPHFSDSVLVHDGTTLLLTGGVTINYPQSTRTETWRLGTSGWQLVPGSVHEPNDYGVVMTYDSTRRELLCLNGNPMIGWTASTWTWNGRWTEHPGLAPLWGGMACDAARGNVVLFGGGSLSTARAETWTWNGSTWTLRTPPQSPPTAYSAKLAYDPIRQRVLLADGTSGSWLWDGTTWTPSPGGPAVFSPLVWDPSRGAIVAANASSTWEWTGAWNQVATTGIAQSVYMAAFDPVRGHTFAYTLTAELEWTGSTWLSRSLPVPMRLQYGGAMATDSDRGRVMFRGVIAPNDGIQLHVLGPTPSVAEDAGGGCPTSLMLVAEQRPGVGELTTLNSRVDPNGVCLFGFAFQPTAISVGSCTLVVDGSAALFWRFASAAGRVDMPLWIPASSSLRGITLLAQAGTLAGSTALLSRAIRLRIGD